MQILTAVYCTYMKQIDLAPLAIPSWIVIVYCGLSVGYKSDLEAIVVVRRY